MKIDAIIQARVDSTRLPGKVLLKINGISVLQCLLNQLNYSKLLDRKIIATTLNPSDDIIIDFIKSISLESFRGNSFDVLDRYYQCAKHFSMKHIVRISSDCPLIDPEIVDKAIIHYKEGNYDYVNNFSKKRYPYGTDVEIFSFNTLEKTWKEAKKLSEREHVTPYIYTNPDNFSIGYIEPQEDFSYLHWSVDRKEDLEFIKILYAKIKKRPILLEDILKVIKDEPSVLEINENSIPNEGYLKSLEDDKKQSLG